MSSPAIYTNISHNKRSTVTGVPYLTRICLELMDGDPGGVFSLVAFFLRFFFLLASVVPIEGELFCQALALASCNLTSRISTDYSLLIIAGNGDGSV